MRAADRRPSGSPPFIGRRGGPQVRCEWDARIDEGYYTCHRMSLPGRLVCHKHAGILKRIRRDRRRRKLGNATKRANR